MRKKIRFYKHLVLEVVETLCTICLYLDRESRYSHNQYGRYMLSHFNELKRSSDAMKDEMGIKEERLKF